MYKYNGLLIYQQHDDDGIIEVVEYKGIRSLHFGSAPRQSSMSLSDPNKLELSYVRAMTSWQLFKSNLDDEALLIGLGGGSLAKYLLKHFSNCRLTAIECRASVVKIARSHFRLPLDPRLKILIDDGSSYIQKRAESYQQRYSLLFIDAFDHENIASSIINERFFHACHCVLKKNGILIINLWGGEDSLTFTQCSTWLKSIFKQQVLFLPVQNRDNVIAFAFNEQLSSYSLKQLRQHADKLEQYYQMEFNTFLKDLKTYNAKTFQEFIGK